MRFWIRKRKRYHKCYNRVDCRRYHMDRPTRSHIPLIKMDWSEIEMKFLDNLFHHKHNSQASFSSISGYDDVKNIIDRVLSSEENFNLLLVGPPASSKTQFLMEIMKARNSKT